MLELDIHAYMAFFKNRESCKCMQLLPKNARLYHNEIKSGSMSPGENRTV
jgi:hypothetical protein